MNSVLDRAAVYFSYDYCIDMMFSAASPLIIYPLWLSKFGRGYRGGSLPLVVFISLTWNLRCGLNTMGLAPEALSTAFEEFCWTDVIHAGPEYSPWGRRNMCYILGLGTGHILHLTKGKKINIPPNANILIWQVVFLILFSIIYAPFDSELDVQIPQTSLQIFWYASSHLLWGLCLAWIIFACCRGLGGLVNEFLSWRVRIPISKISFMTHLVHMDFNWWFFLMQVFSRTCSYEQPTFLGVQS